MTIGERIRAIRKDKGMNQNDFGAKIGLASNTITNYETDRRNPSNQVIELICREFNVSEIWLRTGKGDLFVELDREDELAAWAGKLLHPDNDGSFQQRFVHMLSKLDIEDWKVLEKMAILMVDENKKD
ncbi:MAG: helix-turn-helix transcriptional regulator [Anaerocolumna sp.]